MIGTGRGECISRPVTPAPTPPARPRRARLRAGDIGVHPRIERLTLRAVHFTGFDLRQPGGLLRTIGQQAQEVARKVAR